jgi:DnaJ homologue, subfamily C, member 28, conserved domain
MSPIHRDGAGEETAAPTWESLADRLIREAHERGEWDTGDWLGKRLPAQDGAYESELAAGHAILRNAGVAPSWVETDKAARRLLDERDRLLDVAARTAAPGARSLRARFSTLLDELDRVLLRLETEAPTPAQQRRRVDRAAELAAFDRALAGTEAPGTGMRQATIWPKSTG